MQIKRRIGSYDQGKKGPLVIVVGGIHGNEPAGVLAVERVLERLKVEPYDNPGFDFKGKIVGLSGNVEALKRGVRFRREDLNRMFEEDRMSSILNRNKSELKFEEREAWELYQVIAQEINSSNAKRVVFLDIHTTTAEGGIFSIIPNHEAAEELAVQLHAPVITGMLDGIRGTMLHYFVGQKFGRECIPIAFEAGQHHHIDSVGCAASAIINCLKTIGCVSAEDVEHAHDQRLQEASAKLPDKADLILCHSITDEDQFEMLPGFENFQAVSEGQPLAKDRHGTIRAPQNCLILMPLYQRQGKEGFFLITEKTA